MRVGEVLKLRLKNLQDQKLVIEAPKSGKPHEFVFIPQKVADRLRDYAQQVCKNPEDLIFPISYEAARMIVLKAGNLVGIQQPLHHDTAYPSKSSARSSFAIRTFRQFRVTLER